MIIIELLLGILIGVVATLFALKIPIKRVDESKETTPLADSDFDPLDVIKKLKEESSKKDNIVRETINEVVRIREEKTKLEDYKKKFEELIKLKTAGVETSELIWTMNKFQREIDEKIEEERNKMWSHGGFCSGMIAFTGRIETPETKFDKITGEFFEQEQRLESE